MKSRESGGAGDALLVTIDVAARMLGVSARHLRRMMDRQEFVPPVRIGKALRFERADVLSYIAERKGG